MALVLAIKPIGGLAFGFASAFGGVTPFSTMLAPLVFGKLAIGH